MRNTAVKGLRVSAGIPTMLQASRRIEASCYQRGRGRTARPLSAKGGRIGTRKLRRPAEKEGNFEAWFKRATIPHKRVQPCLSKRGSARRGKHVQRQKRIKEETEAERFLSGNQGRVDSPLYRSKSSRQNTYKKYSGGRRKSSRTETVRIGIEKSSGNVLRESGVRTSAVRSKGGFRPLSYRGEASRKERESPDRRGDMGGTEVRLNRGNLT